MTSLASGSLLFYSVCVCVWGRGGGVRVMVWGVGEWGREMAVCRMCVGYDVRVCEFSLRS